MVSWRSLGLVLPAIAAAIFFISAPVHAQTGASSSFDHAPTGFPLTGTHLSVPCTSCHLNGRFKNTPTRCFGCHNAINFPGLGSVLAHPNTTNYCEGCHQTTTWRDYRFIDHVQALGPCASCHNNKFATGKTPQHLITNEPCNTCHFNTVTFKGGIVPASKPRAPAAATTTPAATTTTAAPTNAGSSKAPNTQTSSGTQTFSGTQGASGTQKSPTSPKATHAGVTGGCATCHNGVAATGKPPNHVPTSSPCEGCHKSTATFAGARMNHAGIVANCATCHNGVLALGRPAKHILTSASCETCHKSTTTFAGARVDHASLTATCVSCHNGGVADGKPPRHLLTTLSCESCHRTTFWTPVTYRHTSPSFVNHGPGVSCSSCHTANAQTVAWKFPAFKPNCAGCHVDKYRPMSHVKFLRPVKFYYTAAELRDCTGACHTSADNTQRNIVTRNFAVHRALGGGW